MKCEKRTVCIKEYPQRNKYPWKEYHKQNSIHKHKEMHILHLQLVINLSRWNSHNSAELPITCIFCKVKTWCSGCQSGQLARIKTALHLGSTHGSMMKSLSIVGKKWEDFFTLNNTVLHIPNSAFRDIILVTKDWPWWECFRPQILANQSLFYWITSC